MATISGNLDTGIYYNYNRFKSTSVYGNFHNLSDISGNGLFEVDNVSYFYNGLNIFNHPLITQNLTVNSTSYFNDTIETKAILSTGRIVSHGITADGYDSYFSDIYTSNITNTALTDSYNLNVENNTTLNHLYVQDINILNDFNIHKNMIIGDISNNGSFICYNNAQFFDSVGVYGTLSTQDFSILGISYFYNTINCLRVNATGEFILNGNLTCSNNGSFANNLEAGVLTVHNDANFLGNMNTQGISMNSGDFNGSNATFNVNNVYAGNHITAYDIVVNDYVNCKTLNTTNNINCNQDLYVTGANNSGSINSGQINSSSDIIANNNIYSNHGYFIQDLSANTIYCDYIICKNLTANSNNNINFTDISCNSITVYNGATFNNSATFNNGLTSYNYSYFNNLIANGITVNGNLSAYNFTGNNFNVLSVLTNNGGIICNGNTKIYGYLSTNGIFCSMDISGNAIRCNNGYIKNNLYCGSLYSTGDISGINIYSNNLNVKNNIYANGDISTNNIYTNSLYSNSIISPTLNNYTPLLQLQNYTLSSTLSNYATKTNLNNYTLSSTLTNYVTNSALNTTLNNYITNSALTTTIVNYTPTIQLNSTLSNYTLSSTLSNYTLSSTLSNYSTIISISGLVSNINLNYGIYSPLISFSYGNTFPNYNSNSLGFNSNSSFTTILNLTSGTVYNLCGGTYAKGIYIINYSILLNNLYNATISSLIFGLSPSPTSFLTATNYPFSHNCYQNIVVSNAVSSNIVYSNSFCLNTGIFTSLNFNFLVQANYSGGPVQIGNTATNSKGVGYSVTRIA